MKYTYRVKAGGVWYAPGKEVPSTAKAVTKMSPENAASAEVEAAPASGTKTKTAKKAGG